MQILQEKKIPGGASVVKIVTSVLAASQRFMREQAVGSIIQKKNSIYYASPFTKQTKRGIIIPTLS